MHFCDCIIDSEGVYAVPPLKTLEALALRFFPTYGSVFVGKLQ